MSDDETYYASGYEDCIIGVCTEEDIPRVVYDKWAMVESYQRQNPDSTWDDAVEFLEFNCWYAWVGKGTPKFLRVFHGTPEEKMHDINQFVCDIVE